NVGAYSGLETKVSDYVGLFGVTTPGGFSISTGGRFDEETFDLRRADVRAGGRFGPVSAAVQYAFIQAQPLYGFDEDRQEISGQTSIRFNENWRGFASGTYDLQKTILVRNTFGFAYSDECFTYRRSSRRWRGPDTGESGQGFGFNVSLRSSGDSASGPGVFAR